MTAVLFGAVSALVGVGEGPRVVCQRSQIRFWR